MKDNQTNTNECVLRVYTPLLPFTSRHICSSFSSSTFSSSFSFPNIKPSQPKWQSQNRCKRSRRIMDSRINNIMNNVLCVGICQIFYRKHAWFLWVFLAFLHFLIFSCKQSCKTRVNSIDRKDHVDSLKRNTRQIQLVMTTPAFFS